MTKRRFHRAGPRVASRLRSTGRGEEVTVILRNFGDYLRALNYVPLTIERYQRMLLRVSAWLHEHRRHPSLHELTRQMVPRMLVQVLPRCSPETRMNYRKALFHWLRFKGRYKQPITYPWATWLSDYLHFLRTHQGVSQSTLDLNEANAKAFLEWQFGTGQADWSRVRPVDIWQFSRFYVRGVKPTTGKSRLGYVRRFLRFVHLRGACGPELAAAIPKVAVRGAWPRPEVLSEQQSRKLLASFKRVSPEGKRNHAMILCMLELGLRSGEVIGLRLQDIDWRGRRLNIRVTKSSRGRQLPLPDHVLEAMRGYIETARPQDSSFDQVFVRHPHRSGYPLSRSALKAIVRHAYRQCGFPATWSGTHRLRHTFATRLHQCGVDMKPIADLLGHRKLDTTNIYTQVDMEALRKLAQPWPWKR